MRPVLPAPVVSAVSTFLDDCWRGIQLVLVFLIAASTFGLPPSASRVFAPIDAVRQETPTVDVGLANTGDAFVCTATYGVSEHEFVTKH